MTSSTTEMTSVSERTLTLEVSMSDDQSIQEVPKPGPAETAQPIQYPKEGAFWPAFLTFLSSPAGKEVNQKLAEWLGTLKEGQQQKHVVTLIATVGRYILMAGIIGSAVWLQKDKALDSAVTGLLGLALGYLFGRQHSQE